MWQDGLALLIVAIAASALLRNYWPSGLFRFGARPSVQKASSTGGCGGCPPGAACFKARVKVYPATVQRRERLRDGGH